LAVRIDSLQLLAHWLFVLFFFSPAISLAGAA
jgi:hypothetical protein